MICFIYLFIQFYLVLGLILRFLHKYINWVAVILILVGIVTRFLHLRYAAEFSLNPLAYGVPIGLGLFIAQAIRDESKLIKIIKSVKKGQNIGIYVLGIVFLISSYFVFGNTYGSVFIPLVSGLFFIYIVIEQTFGNSSFVKLKTQKSYRILEKFHLGCLFFSRLLEFY